MVLYDTYQGICIITIDKPETRNALSIETFDQLEDAFDRAENDQAVVILTGTEEVFSSGFHLDELKGSVEKRSELMDAASNFLSRMLSFPYPIISAVSGHALPGSMLLLLASDVRLGVKGDYLYGLDAVRIGITFPVWAIELARGRLTPSALQRALTVGLMVGPDEAKEAGYFDQIVEPENLMDAAMDLAKQFSSLDMDIHLQTKLLLRDSWIEAFDEARLA